VVTVHSPYYCVLEVRPPPQTGKSWIHHYTDTYKGGYELPNCSTTQTYAGQLPALQTHAWRDNVKRKAVPFKGGERLQLVRYILFVKVQM